MTSRRRHTRWPRDWSSDVCSSDLSGHRDTVFRDFDQLEDGDEFHVKMEYGTYIYEISDHEIVAADNTTVIDPRSEERRVGKEWRYQGEAYMSEKEVQK